MLDPFTLPYVREGLIEILLLSVATGLIGSWLVLRGLAFYSHAVGTASFPGLVLADGIGFPAAAGAFGMAGVFTALSSTLTRSRRAGTDSVTALVLVGCMAAGVILASDVFGSGANVDTLLFGSLLAVDPTDLWLAAVAAIVSVLAVRFLSHRWLAKGFDEPSARTLNSGSGVFDLALMAVVAFTVVSALNAVGALLVAALMVIPAATVRLFTRRISTLQAGSVLLVAFEGTAGLWLSVKTDAPPGATIAVVSGVIFALSAFVRKLRSGIRPRSRRLLTAAVALIILGGFGTGCGSSGDDPGSHGKKVTATTTQVADLVSEVGGDRIELSGILQPNTDPHDYDPRPSDVQSVADARLVFRSGGHLDEWVADLVTDSGSDAEVVDLSHDLPVELHGDHTHEDDPGLDESGHEHDGEELDPHWWHDPVNVEAAVREIAQTLADADPENANFFRRNAREYRRRVTGLMHAIDRCVKKVPREERKVVTDHDAFGYFTHRFGITTVGTVLPALTTQAQPSAGDLADLERTIQEENVKAIFPEESVSPRIAEAIARDTGVRADYSLYGDTLGPEGSAGETWIGMMKTNADNLVAGMSGGDERCHP